MTPKQLERIKKEALAQLGELFEEQTDSICAAYKTAYQNHDGSKPFKFNLPANIGIEPDNGKIIVSTRLSHSVRTTANTDGVLEITPDMFKEAGE